MIKTKKKMTIRTIKKNKTKGLKWQWVRWTPPLNSQGKPRSKWRKKKNKKDAGKNKRPLRDNKRMTMHLRLKWAEWEKEGRKELKLQLVVRLSKRVNLMLRG